MDRLQDRLIVSIDTYRARSVRELYRHRVYPPNFMKVSYLADVITAFGHRERATTAIRKTAMDDFSPVVFVKGSNQQAVSFGQGPSAQLNKEAREWIEMWDESELPPGLE